MITLFYVDNQPVNEVLKDRTILTKDCEKYPADSLLDRMELLELTVETPLDIMRYAIHLPEEASDLGSIHAGDTVMLPKAGGRAEMLYPLGQETLDELDFHELDEYTFYRVASFTEDLTVAAFIEWENS